MRNSSTLTKLLKITSSVVTARCRNLMRMSCCFASSRENTINLRGVPSSADSTRCKNVRPIEPVPPVTRIVLPWSSILAVGPLADLGCQSGNHHVPAGWGILELRSEARRNQAAIAEELIVGIDLDAQPTRLVEA